MKKILTALAAAGVIVAGGFVSAAVSSPSTAVAQQAPDTTADDTTTDGSIDDIIDDEARPKRGAILDSVLDQLVADGVIDADQADQVKAALEAKHEELREQFGERRSRGHRFGGGDRFGLMEMFEDGVIDANELASLPDGHPLNDPEGPAAAYLDDGQLTQEELDELRAELRPQRGFGHRGWGDYGTVEDATLSA